MLAEHVGCGAVCAIDPPPPVPSPPPPSYAVAMGLATALTATGRFIVRSPVAPEAGLPLVAFSLKERGVGYDEFDVAEVLREHGEF